MVDAPRTLDRPAAAPPRLHAPTDHRDEPALRGWLRRTIARGYQPQPAAMVPVTYVLGGEATRDVASAFGAPDAVRVGIVAPSHVARCTADEHARWLAGLVDQVRDATRMNPHVHVVIFLGMQWLRPEDEPESLRRLALLTAGVDSEPVAVVGLALPGPGKARSLNAAIRLCEQGGFTAVGWFDDDVLLEPGCLGALIADFLADGARGAVGATKIPHARSYATSRILFRAKEIATPATNYPHGCAMLVALDVVAGGIPERYVCDDGYVCFRLLDPSLDNPLRYLRLVDGARCHYHVAGPAGESRRRIRRLLRNHHIFLADWPLPSSRYYLRQVLFRGMWPLTGWDARRGWRIGVLNAAIKWLYFCFFVAVGTELFARGLRGKPLRVVKWAGYSTAERPREARG